MMPDVDWLVGLAWKSLVVAGTALVLLRLMRSRSAAQRSFVAHLGLLAILALPVATLLLPAWSALPATGYAAAAEAAPAADLPRATAPAALPDVAAPLPVASASTVTLWVYGAAALVLLLALLVSVARLFAMRRRAAVLLDARWIVALAEAQRRMNFKHGTALLVSDELRSPISWGVVRPVIVLDPAAVAAPGEAEAIIAHELAHVARLDWAKLLAARIATTLFWFNPLVWLLARESHQLREEAADDAVLLTDVAGPDYATLLVNAARHDNASMLMAAHGVAPSRDSLKRRITRVLDRTLDRAPVSATFGGIALVLVLGFAGPLAALTARSAAPATTEPFVNRSALPIGVRPSPAVAVPAPAHGEGRDREAAAADAKAVAAERGARASSVGERPSLNDLVAASAVGADPVYAAQVRAVFPDASVRDLVAARALGVTPAYARALRDRYRNATFTDVIRMGALHMAAHEDASTDGHDDGSEDDSHDDRAGAADDDPPDRSDHY